MAARVSLTVPIWFSLIRIAFPTFCSMPRARSFSLVTKMSSPTSCRREPSAAVSRCHPAQSSSPSPSSIETMG